MSIGIITALMFLCMFVGMVFGLDLGFLLGAIAVGFTIFLWGPHALGSLAIVIYHWSTIYSFTCVPLFVFMAMMLERAGIADALYATMYKWTGRLRGGLAMGTVGICTLMAAMTGSSGMASTTMGIIALPSMLKRGYEKHMILGAIMAGAALGSLIPPSIIMVVFALFTQESIGRLFIGGIIPGFILSAMFITYIGVRCLINPSYGPPLPKSETVSFKEKMVSLSTVILPILIIVSIMGSIFGGIATPTEAASVGAFGALICAAINKKLTWQNIKESSLRTLSVSVMIKWIVFGASCFATIYSGLGATRLMSQLVENLALNRWMVLIMMQIVWLLLGCVLNGMAILMITLPVFMPVAQALGFDTLWFGIVFVVNMEMGQLTPPFGYTIFYMKAVAPPEITMGNIYRAIIPYVALQMVGLALVMIFPQLATWLPSKIIRTGR